MRHFSSKYGNVFPTPKDKLALIFFTYRDVIAPRFIRWLEIAYEGAMSKVAKKACADNLRCEIKENHPKMLRDFVAPLEKKYWSPRLTKEMVENCMDNIRHLNRFAATEVEGLIMLAALENASLVFVPWMQEAAKRLGLKKLKYLKKHGIADIAHATEFIKAAKGDTDCRHSAPNPQERRLLYLHVQQLLFKIFWSPTGRLA